MKQLASNFIDAMRSQPLALTLVAINVLYLVGGVYVLKEVGGNNRDRDKMIVEMMKGCIK